jgi:hypothetical protein
VVGGDVGAGVGGAASMGATGIPGVSVQALYISCNGTLKAALTPAMSRKKALPNMPF